MKQHPKFYRSHVNRACAWLGMSLLTVGLSASAQTIQTWNPSLEGSYSWQNLNHWAPLSLLPVDLGTLPAAEDTVVWDGSFLTGVQTIELDGVATIGNLHLMGSSHGGAMIMAPGAGGQLVFNNGLTDMLPNASNLIKSGVGTVALMAPISFAAPMSIQVEDGNLVLGGILSGTNGFTKTGEGTLWLRNTAANTFTGISYINEGMVISAPLPNTGQALGAVGSENLTFIANGATFAVGAANNGQSGINTGETFIVEGRGFRNLGAIRAFNNGAHVSVISGSVMMTDLTRFHAGNGTELTISSAFDANQTVEITGQRLVNFSGAVSGSSTINSFGIGGVRLLNTTAGQSYSGTINTFNGEVRSDADTSIPVVGPYDSIAALNLRNSMLRLAARIGAGAGTAPAGPTPNNALFSTTAPISMMASRIYLDNRAYNASTGSQITYAFSQDFGTVTALSGHNQIGLRAAVSTGSVTMNFADILLPSPGTTLQFFSDNNTANNYLGQTAMNRILNQALEAGELDVPFVGGNVFSNTEWVKYNTVFNGGHGYTPLVAADYAINSGEGTWAAGQNIKITTVGTTTLTGDRSIQSLNMQDGTARTLTGNAGVTLTIDSGGLLTSGGTHVISVPSLTAGADSGYHLYNIAWGANTINSAIVDNGLNPVTLVKNGGSTSSLLGANTYTGSTIMNEGQLRDAVGSKRVGLGAGNLHFAGSPNTQSTYESDRDFVRPLGAGVGEVQLTGGGSGVGGSTGFSGYGRHIQLNFGGNADTVVWGSQYFNPGVFTLNGGNSTHPLTLVNPLDLDGEQRYIRVDGGAAGGGRGAIGILGADVFNGGIVKRGGGTLLMNREFTYQSGTVIEQGLVWLRAGGNLGDNVMGNDIDIRSEGTLHIDSPDLIGSRQMIYLQNRDPNSPAAIGFGAGYGDGSGIVFNSFKNNGGIPLGGGNNVFITDSANAARRIAIQMNGMSPTSVDFPGLIKDVTNTNTEVWFGATSANGIFTGNTLTPTGAVSAYRLGAGFGTLTIQNANVLDGAATLIVGADQQDGRTGLGGVVYLPQPQNFSGTITHASVTGGTMIGNSGILVVGSNASLNHANNTILLRGGDLRLNVAAGTYGGVDTQYADRNIDVAGGNSALRVESLAGSGNTLVQLNSLRLDGADRVITITSSTTRQNGVLFLGTTTLNHSAATNHFFNVGFENQGFNSGFAFLQGPVVQTGSGNKTLVKRDGGTLVLMADNSHFGTQIQQGNLVLTHTGAAGAAGATITMNTNNDRNSRLYFMMDGAGPHLFDTNLTFQGGNNGSVRWVGVGPRTADWSNLDTEIRINNMTMSVAASVNNGNIIFDGAHGHRLTVTGNTVMNRDTRFRVRGTTLTLDGTVSGAFALNKAEFGTLVLNGSNTYTGATTLEQGTLVAGHANAFGNATSNIVFSGGSSSQLLLAGSMIMSRHFVNSATGNAQVLGGLDAGNKAFSGNVALTGRGVHLAAQTGGDVSFTGTISGAGATGITKIGPGTVILNPASGTGNTYSDGTLVASGILAGVAQATSGSPFGTGAMDIRNGALALQGIASATNTATTGALTISGGANLAIWSPAPVATAMTFGSLVRTNNGTLTVTPYTGSLAVNEQLSFTSAPALTNGIIEPWMVAANSSVNFSGNYVTYSGGQVTTATYSGVGDLDGMAAGNVWDAGGIGGLLTGDRAGYAFRSNADVDLGGNVLTLGASGLAGIILNDGASILGAAGSRIDLGINQLNLYTHTVSSLSVPLTSFRPNQDNTLTTVGLVKFGQGELTLGAGALNGLQNSITVNEGTLSAAAANVFPMFENLNALTGAILTINPNGSVLLNGFDQEIGNLQGIAPSNNINTRFFDTGGTLDLGGATLTVGRQGTTMVFGGQLIGGVGSRLVKVGGGDLSFTNINPDRINSLETLQIDQGSVTTRADDNSMGQAGNVAFSLPSSTEVVLRGGRWNLRSFADGTGNQQTVLVGNNVTAYGANSILSVDRPESSGSNKHLLLGDLSIGLNNFLITAANSYTVGFEGTTTLTNHARIQTDTQLVLRGVIDDGGMGYTLNKVGGSDLGIGADNSGSWSGGFVARQGFTYLGIRGRDEIMAPGNFISGNPNANLGTGSIVLSQGLTSTTALRIYAPSNILTAQGQTVTMFGSDLAGRVRLDIGTDAPLTEYGLRSTTNGSLSLGIGDGGFYTTHLNQAMMGNGKWGLSAFQTTYYLPETLGAGVDNVYRFAGTTGVLGLITPNILNGTASMEIGRSSLHVGNVPTSSPGFLRTYGDQSFTGSTIIHRGADAGSIGGIWEFHGDLATPSIENYGRLEARGDGRFVNDAGDMVNQVVLRPGSVLRFNYNMDVNDQFIVSRQDNSNLGLNERKWKDDEPIFLDGAQLQLTSASGRVSQETVGQITVAGGAGILLERVGSGQPVLITNDGLIRQGQATLTIRNTSAAELGSIALQSQKFYIEDAAWVTANRNNGMLSPWMFSLSNLSFLDYAPGTETGMTNASWTQTGTGAAFLAGLAATDRAHYTAGNATLTGEANVYAMRIVGGTTLTSQQINIHSGGLITNEAVTINSNLYFGNGSSPVEGIVATANNTLTLGGVVTAANFTKAGPGSLVLSNVGNQITGNFQMNGGTVTANGPGTLGFASITLHADYLNNNNGNQMPFLNLRTASSNGTFNNPVILAANVPLARLDFNRFSGSGSGTITIPSLTIEGTDGSAGTMLQLEHQNSYNSAISGAVTMGGSSDVGIRVNAGTSTWNGVVTATMGNLIKSGDGTLTMTNLNNELDTGLILNRGSVVSYANSSGQSFRGNLELNFGTLTVGNTTGTVGTVFAEPNQTIAINGQVTLRNQRFGSSNAHMQVGADNNGNVLTTSNSPWIIFQGNSFGDQLNLRYDIVINDMPWFRSDSAFTRLVGPASVSGEGKFNKVGNYYFGLENTVANTYTGGTDIWAGEFMVRTTQATMGTGEVRLYPGAALTVRSVANLGTTGLTQVVTSAGAFPILAVRNGDGGNAQFDAVMNAYASANFLGNGNGIIGLGGGRNYSADPDMANRNGGIFANWWLGSVEGSGIISANSVSPWGVGGDVFLLGGGQNGTLTMNPATAGSDQLAGAANRLVVGGGLSQMGYGIVSIGVNADNSFGGGTLVQLSRDIGGTGFRGARLRIEGGQTAADVYRSPLGTGQVDVYGEIRVEGANATLRGGDDTNANVWVFHPGSRLRFDNGGNSDSTTGNTVFAHAGTEGRWADSVPITLNTTVLEMYGANSNNVYNSETVGDLIIQGGSEVVVRRRSTNWAELVAGDITRTGSATLTITGMVDNTNNATGLGVAGTTSAMRFLVNNGASLMNNGMVDPWIMDRVGGQFLKYTAEGFAPITVGGAPANYVATTNTSLSTAVIGVNDGTRIVSLEGSANFTLGNDLDIYALRLNRDINVAADGSANNIIIRSGGITQYGNTPTINANLFFGPLGDGTGEALLHASNNTLQINGKIHASQVTKFGSAFVNVRSDQPQFTGDWVVNGGGIQFLTPGAPSSGSIYLNGSRMNDRDNTQNITEVRFNYNPQSPDLFTWSHGKIVSTGYNRIYGLATNDRQIAIGDIDLMGTGTAQEGLVTLRMDGARSTMHTGTVTLFGHYQLNIENNLNSGGTTGGVQIGVLDNQGQYDVRKAGWGLLSLGDQSGSFTDATFSIAHGGVRALHNGSFGDATASLIVDPTGALEIAVANWLPLASVTQAWGSSERWSVNQARGAGDWTMAPGVNLQIMASQTGARVITLDGGALAGYVPIDWDQDAIIHTLSSDITLNLASNSVLGQLQPAGNSNGSNHTYYDNGKLNTTTDLNPNGPGLRGSYLQIMGEITGVGGLTKVGQDLILLGGANSYLGATQIDNGILQIGRNNSLPVGTDLITRFTGMLDLNGFDQEVSSLSGTGGSINNGAFAVNTLIVNQAVDTLYRGAINGNVRLVKDGSGELILNPTLGVSGYRGGTELLAGVLSVGSDAALGWAPLHADAANITFNGGTLRTTSSFALAATRGLFFEGVGGAIEVADGEQLTIDSEIHTAQGASFGKTGTGALLVNREQSYEGDTQVMEGVLVVGAEDVLSRWSRHYVYGGLESGVLDLNGFDVSIGSLASAGLDETAATVLIGANTLTLGYDGTMDAVYQGVISGLGRVVKVGGGTQTFSGNANGAEGWSLDVAEGTVVVGAQGALGSGSILLGTDDHAYGLAALQLMAEAVMTQAITVGGNHQGSVAQIRQQVSGTVDLDGTLTLNRDLFLGAAASSVLSLNEAVSGVGRITVLDEGTVRLGFANTFGAGAGTTSSSAVDGGLIIRSGTVELGSGLAAGSGTIEMGDLAFGIAAVAGATTAMLDAAFDPTGNGLGGTGLGALSGVPDTIDGVTYVVGDRILVKDQHAAPEQNGVYEVVSVAGGQMVLVRASDFNAMAPNLAAHLGNPAITYGVQVPVTGGGQAGQSFFVASKNMGLLNESPIVFLRDVVSPNVALMQSASGLTVANAIDLNSLNSSGTMTLGGNFTSGSSTFSGPITLTNMLEDTAETVTLVLSSASGDDAGVLISGVISEADSTDLTGDTLSLMKVGSGVVTLSGVNTFRGATLISEGTLAISSTQALGLAPAAFSASHLTIDGGALRALSSFSLNEATRGITLGAGGGTLDVVDGETLTVSGVIAGAGNLQKTGTGTVVLEADNTFGGSTSVLAGVLAISSEANLGPNPAVFDAAHLLLDGGALRTTATFSLQDSNRGVTLGAAGGTFAPVVDTTLTIANVIAGSGNLIKADAGTLILSAANTYTGDTLVTGGTLVLSAADSISPGAVLISGGGVLDVGANTINVDSLGFAGVGGSTAGSGGINAANGFVFTNTNPVSVSNALGGTGSLEVSGPGSVTLLGMNSYSGGTTISDAALFVGPGSSLGSGPVSVQAGGTLSAVGSLGNDIHFAGGFGSPAVLQVGSESQGGGVNLLTLGGAVSFDDEAIIDFYLSQTGFSQLELANLTSFDPGARFRINLVDGYMPADGSAFQILAWDASALGAVNWLDRMILPGGVNWVVPADFSTSGLLTVFGDATDPSFILQPAGVVTSIGGSITLTVAVAGSEPILIQWVKDGDDLPGETNLTLSIPFAELTDGGNYRARATNGVDTALSDLVLVVVSDTPVVVSLPQGATILQGGSHTFEVSAVGPGPFTYEWKRGAVVVGGDSPVLEITNAQFSDAGSYTVTITNANGSVDTVDNPAVLVVSNPVSFDEHPENVTAAEGRTVTFNTLVSGTGPFEFQWQLLGGSGWEDVAGAEGDSLTLTVPNAVEGTEFQYRLRAASTQGGDPVFSDVAVLTVGSPLIDLTGALPAGKIIRTGEDLVIEVQPAGGALPMTYQWFFNGTAIPGQTHAELLIPNASLAQVGAYRCQLSNTYTTASGTANDLKVTGDVLVAVVDSADAWLAVQDTAGRATLRVTARARTASDLSYQWVDGNGNDILGATAASYTASDLLGGQVYDFSCRVTYAPAADSAIGGETVVYVYTGAPQWPAGVPLTSSPTNPIPLPDGSVGQGFNYQVPLPGQTVTDNAGTPVASGAATAANMPASFSASGLPPGLRIDNRGQITGVPTAERRDRSGAVIPYVITVTARNNYGVVTPVLVFSLTIQPLADTVVGDFTGPIERHYLNDNLGGAVLVKTNKRGAYTGTVTMGTKRFRFRGALVSTGVGSNPEATAVISRGKRLPALVMTFALDATTQVISVGNIREATDNSGDMDKRAQFTGWRYVFKPSKANKTPAAAYAGVYNVGLFLPDELVDETSTLVPQGIGYASFNINAKNGRLRVNGRLGDGTAFVTATYVGPGGQVMVFRTLYNAKARGSVVGSMTVDLSQVVDTGSGLVGAVTGSLDWLRPALATSALYPAGFQVEELEVEGSRYVAPARFERVMGLPAANFGDSNALVRFAGANLEVDQQPLTGPVANSVGLRVDELNKVQADLLNDPRLLTMRIVSKSGAFNGRYTLEEANPIVGARPDRIRRVTSYQGLIIRVNDGLSWTPMGVGYTLVRQLPNRPSANLSGSVVFEKLP